jgi:hypothetical protein
VYGSFRKPYLVNRWKVDYGRAHPSTRHSNSVATKMLLSIVTRPEIKIRFLECHMESKRCRHCDTNLVTSQEQYVHVCYQCRRTALLTGRWPEELPGSKRPVQRPKTSFWSSSRNSLLNNYSRGEDK